MSGAIKSINPLGFVWETQDPFLFCVHHDDTYPAGNEQLGPNASLEGRNLGMDFELKDGWRMYHGQAVPGFPQHPHRGFETVTLVRKGFIDHADSLGATARYGGGDVQWLTTGSGIVHAEMFPLLDTEAKNRVELFQIWLNLPRADKMVDPHFSMLWNNEIPILTFGEDGKRTTVTLVAGRIDDTSAPNPPPKSWAARADSDIAIWTIKMEPGARWTVPAAATGSNRTLYFFTGDSLRLDDTDIPPYSGVRVVPDQALTIENGPTESELLLLQAKPIAEPVAHYGPFVMSSPGELKQAFLDYEETRFGGWPWPSDEPVHPRDKKRHARHADGTVEEAAD